MPISTNLKEINTTSDLSVFDSFWTDPLPVERNYVTLRELGIDIQADCHMRNSDYEDSIELRITSDNISDNEEKAARNLRSVREGYVCANERLPVDEVNLDSNSTYSLDFAAIQELFQNGQDLQMVEKLSEQSDSENCSIPGQGLDSNLPSNESPLPPAFTEQASQQYIHLDDVSFTYPNPMSDSLWIEDSPPSFISTPSNSEYLPPCGVPNPSFLPLQLDTEPPLHHNLDSGHSATSFQADNINSSE